MRHLVLPGTVLDVSRICYGTADFGTGVQGPAVAELLDAFRAGGGNFVDTAHCYGFWMPGGEGASERALGEYMRCNGKGGLVVATKGCHPSIGAYQRGNEWLTPQRVAADLDDSLERLGLDAVDLYCLHRDDTSKSVGEVIEALNEEVRRGRVRYLGASNWTWPRIEEANAYAAAHGLRGFAASQVEWSLAHKETPPPEPRGTQAVYAGPDDVAFHARTQMPLVAYTATARGYFASGTQKRADFDNSVSRARLTRAIGLASELNVTPNQVALAWLMNQPFPVVPITGTHSVAHLREALAAADIMLTPEQVRWLRDG